MALTTDVTMPSTAVQHQLNGIYVPSGQTLSIAGTFELGGVAVTATAADLNAVAGVALATTQITASDASLDITGLAAAQGGAVVLTGGASSTTGNVGGAIMLVGGAGGATAAGGPVTITGAASAGAGGTGGAVALASGAATGGAEGAVKIQTVATGKLGFFNVTPVVRQSAYTQTYSTATKTHSNVTQQVVTAVANVTGATENYVFPDSSATVTQAEYRVLAKTIYLLFGQVLADIANVKGVLNSVIDDGQAYGILA